MPVGFIKDLGDIEASAVIYFRLWFDNPISQEDVYSDFYTVLGAEDGENSLRSMKQLYQLFADHGRRPLIRHDICCKCVGADESCFGNLIAAAIEADQEDAMLLASLFVKPKVAPVLVILAKNFGLALKKISYNSKNSKALEYEFQSTGYTLH